jgi:hypothetical protein
MARNDFQGALDLFILKTLAQLGSVHGYGITVHIQRVSDDLLRIEACIRLSIVWSAPASSVPNGRSQRRTAARNSIC